MTKLGCQMIKQEKRTTQSELKVYKLSYALVCLSQTPATLDKELEWAINSTRPFILDTSSSALINDVSDVSGAIPKAEKVPDQTHSLYQY